MKRTKHNINNADLALELFSSDAFLTVNKKLLSNYGPELAIFISNLIDKYRYFKKHNQTNDNWFFLIHKQQMEQTGISEYNIRKCKKELRKRGILLTKKKGLPAKEWYKINLNKLLNDVGQDLIDLIGHKDTAIIGLYKENKDKENKKKKKEILFLKTFPEKWQENNSFKQTIQDFIKHRKEVGSPLTPLAAQRLSIKLNKSTMPAVIDALNTSIENGWKGVWPESSKTPAEEALSIETLEAWYDKHQQRPSDQELTELFHSSDQYNRDKASLWYRTIPNNIEFGGMYEKWLKQQDWLSEISSKMYSPTSKVFQQFFKQAQKDFGIDFLTGRKL